MIPANNQIEELDLSTPILMLGVIAVIGVVCGFCLNLPPAMQAETINSQHVASHTPGYYEYSQFVAANP